jgi:AhpD family alkylhydroperoxidase
MKKFDDFHARRQSGNDKIMQQDFLPYKRFMALDTKTYEEGAISAKNKELMGLVGSMVLRCNDCILYHIEKSVQAGASKDEINEACNIALVIGGSIVIPHLRFALEALDELQ